MRVIVCARVCMCMFVYMYVCVYERASAYAWKCVRGARVFTLSTPLQKIEATQYPLLIKNSLDADMLVCLINVFLSHFVPAQLPVAAALQGLSKVARFDTVLMFLEPSVSDLYFVIILQIYFCVKCLLRFAHCHH